MSVPTYDSWRGVPDHLVLETQLGKLDLPRAVGGPVRAWIDTFNAIGKPETFALYDMRESVPTTGTAAALEAAAARRTRIYRCSDCGANTETELGVHHPCRRSHGSTEQPCPHLGRRCAMCRKVAELAHAARQAAAARTAASRWAARTLQSNAVLVRVVTLYPNPATAESGRRRPPIGWRIDAVEADGAALKMPPIARASTKATGLGPGALDAADGAALLRTLLGGRLVVAYTDDERELLRTRLAAIRTDEPAGPPEFAGLFRTELTAWRSLIDPRTAAPAMPLDPGPADRCALLLRRMANDALVGTDTTREGTS